MRTADERARLSVSALFLLNGAAFANLVPRYPEIKSALELTNAEFGLAVAAYPLGAVVIGALGGVLVGRWGSARVASVSLVLVCLNLVFIGTAPNLIALAIAIAIAGSLDATADVANNAHGLRIERSFGRSILNSMHGLWSVGAVLGGFMGAGAAGLGIPLGWHLAAAGAFFLVLAIIASRSLLPGSDTSEAADADAPHARVTRWPLIRMLIALGIIAASANVMEDIGATWSAVYLRGSLDSGPAIAGFGFIALQASQTITRFAGDWLVTRFGDRAVARVGSAIALLGMSAALIVATPAMTIIGFALVGAGIGTLIPGAMRTAESLPGVPHGAGITWVSTVIRVSLLASPPLIGIVADATSLRVALIAIPLAAAAIFALSRAMQRRA